MNVIQNSTVTDLINVLHGVGDYPETTRQDKILIRDFDAVYLNTQAASKS